MRPVWDFPLPPALCLCGMLSSCPESGKKKIYNNERNENKRSAAHAQFHIRMAFLPLSRRPSSRAQQLLYFEANEKQFLCHNYPRVPKRKKNAKWGKCQPPVRCLSLLFSIRYKNILEKPEDSDWLVWKVSQVAQISGRSAGGTGGLDVVQLRFDSHWAARQISRCRWIIIVAALGFLHDYWKIPQISSYGYYLLWMVIEDFIKNLRLHCPICRKIWDTKK